MLSPTLFSIYVDSILSNLSNYGCSINGICCSSFFYADDLILLSPSVAELQRMLDVCCQELESINLKLNVNKSCCLRIGKRCYAKCCNVFTSGGDYPLG